MKNFFKFFGILLVVGTISFAASVYVSKNNIAFSLLSGNASTQAGAISSEISRKPTKLSGNDEALSFYVLPGKTELRYYVPKTGDIKSVDLVRRDNPVRIASLRSGARSISWSQDGTSVIADYADGAVVTNLKSGSSQKVAAGINRAVFSPYNPSVAYTYFDDTKGTGSISTADANFQNFRNVLTTRYKNWGIRWISQYQLALTATKNPAQQTSVFMLDPVGPKLTILVDGQRDVDTNWSTDGKHLLFAQRTTKGISLFVRSVDQEESRPLGIVSRASKCAWANDSQAIYCAVPNEGKMPITGSDDNFILIQLNDTQKPETIRTFEETGYVDARDMTYSKAATALVFKNFKDGRLYSLPLAR